MFKKTQLAILISCVSASSYAYLISSDLKIVNNTNIPMTVFVTEQPKPNGGKNELQGDVKNIPLPAYGFVDVTNPKGVKLNNGRPWGGVGLWKLDSAVITVRGETDHKIYLQGRLNYYIDDFSGRMQPDQYSFLDSIFIASGLKQQPTYTCGSSTSFYPTFDNQITIGYKGGSTTVGELPDLTKNEFPQVVTCNGLNYSNLEAGGSNVYQTYRPHCFDGSKATFNYQYQKDNTENKITTYVYSLSGKNYSVTVDEADNHNAALVQQKFDKKLGNGFCKSRTFN